MASLAALGLLCVGAYQCTPSAPGAQTPAEPEACERLKQAGIDLTGQSPELALGDRLEAEFDRALVAPATMGALATTVVLFIPERDDLNRASSLLEANPLLHVKGKTYVECGKGRSTGLLAVSGKIGVLSQNLIAVPGAVYADVPSDAIVALLPARVKCSTDALEALDEALAGARLVLDLYLVDAASPAKIEPHLGAIKGLAVEKVSTYPDLEHAVVRVGGTPAQLWKAIEHAEVFSAELPDRGRRD